MFFGFAPVGDVSCTLGIMGQTFTPRQLRARDGVLLGSEVAARLGITPKGFYGRRARGTFDLDPTPWSRDTRDVWSVEAVDAWIESHRIVRYKIGGH